MFRNYPKILVLLPRLFTCVLFTCVLSSVVYPQTSAQERAQRLHDHLNELQSRQIDLESRLDMLNEQLKPENIEKSLAGVGSTKPEDLRELRRKQLETEKANVEKQLSTLNEDRMRLETGAAQADAQAYQQSALTNSTNDNANTTSTTAQSSQTRQRHRVRPRRVNRVRQ